MSDLVANGYDAVYDALPRSPTFQRIWAPLACGPEYPTGFENISFVTAAELEDVAGRLMLPAGGTIVDLACGAGGPGLWWASRCSAGRLVGVDLSGIGVTSARERARSLNLATGSHFVRGTFSSVPLRSEQTDGAVSVDALQYAPDKFAALREARRLLRTGGRFAFTAFEVEPDRVNDLPVLGDHPVDDFRPALEEAGFTIEHYGETPGWRDRVTAAYGAVIDAADVLALELGTPAYFALAGEMTLTLERDFYRRRVLAVARAA